MSTIGLSFGMLGFILSLVAISQSAAATERIKMLEERLEKAGFDSIDGPED